MANWITTTVKAENFEILKEKLLRKPTAEELEEDKDLSADSTIIDFNTLIPRHKDLNITAGSHEWQTDKYGWGFNKEKISRQTREIKPILDKLIHNCNTQQEFVKKVNKSLATYLYKFVDVYELRTDDKEQLKEWIENIVKGYYNIVKHGYKSWYEWSYDKWGTKWNGGTPIAIDENKNTVVFSTANGLALPVLAELSKFTPVVVAYADEDTGSNYGILALKDGDKVAIILDDSNKDIGESMACRGDDEEDIDLNYGTDDNYTNEEIEEYWHTDRETLLNNIHSSFQETNKILASLF